MPNEWLNYHHLLYFWHVAKEGSIRKASDQLNISQPSICSQIQSLEESFGTKLFSRKGRSLVLTEFGNMVYDYADDIFTLGGELSRAVRSGFTDKTPRFNVGISDACPKLVTQAILDPVFAPDHSFHVVCHEGKVEDLLAQLASLRLDIVLADEPASSCLPFKAFNHPLGSCEVTICAAPELAKQLREDFPNSLDAAPALLPTENTALRRSLETWFEENRIRPRIVAEFQDAALMKAVAYKGYGFLPVPTAALPAALHHFKLEVVGVCSTCRDQFYAITAERRLTHPAIRLITDNAQLVFPPSPPPRIKPIPRAIPERTNGKIAALG